MATITDGSDSASQQSLAQAGASNFTRWVVLICLSSLAVYAFISIASHFGINHQILALFGSVTLLLAALMIVVLTGWIILTLVLLIFVPSVYAGRRSLSDWVRSLLLLPSVAFFTWLFQDVKELDAAKESVRAWMPGNSEFADWIVIGLAAILAAMGFYVLCLGLLQMFVSLGQSVRIAFKQFDRFAKGVSETLSVWHNWLITSRSAPSSPKSFWEQSAPMMLVISTGVFVLAPFFFFFRERGPDWTGIGLSAIGFGVAASELRKLSNSTRAGQMWPSLVCVAMIVLLMLPNLGPRQESASVLPSAAEAWPAAIRLIFRDCCICICLTLGAIVVLTRGLPQALVLCVGRTLWQVTFVYLGGKAVVLGLGVLVSWSAGSFNTKVNLSVDKPPPKPVAKSQPVNKSQLGLGVLVSWSAGPFTTDINLPVDKSQPKQDDKVQPVNNSQPENKMRPGIDLSKVFEVLSGDYFYMGWSGEVLQADEFLYARWNQKLKDSIKLDRTMKRKFDDLSHDFRQYYDLRFGMLVFTQILFGWHYGLTLLCYLLFAFAWYAFRYPEPAGNADDHSAGEKFLVDRLRTGTLDRIRESSNALVTLGFVGTLLGLSQAIFFLSAADPLSELLGRSGVSSRLAGSLGLGFFTTLLSMVLRLALNFQFSEWAGTHCGYQKQLRILADQG